MTLRAASLVLCSVLLACGGATSPSPSAPASAAPADGNAVQPDGPLTDVVLRHGRMTSVMDSPVGQRNKAAAAVESSDLARQLGALGLRLRVQFDDAAGDDVVLTTLDGRELGRVALEDVARGTAPADLVAHIKALAAPR